MAGTGCWWVMDVACFVEFEGWINFFSGGDRGPAEGKMTVRYLSL